MKNIYQLLQANGALITTLYKAGVINPAVIRNFEIYTYYRDAINAGAERTQAAQATAKRFKVCTRTVYNARAEMLKLC